MGTTRFFLALLLLLGSLWITPCTADVTPDTRLGEFINSLQSQGFSVQTGTTKKAVPLQWVDIQFIDSAAGNNAGHYYKIPVGLDLPVELILKKSWACS